MERVTVVNHITIQGIYILFMAGHISKVICSFDSQFGPSYDKLNHMYVDGKRVDEGFVNLEYEEEKLYYSREG